MQTQLGWSQPLNLSTSDGQSNYPSLAVDPSGGVHVVWSEVTEDGRSFISYSQLNDGAWSPANEIITSPYSQTANYPALAADSQGYLHLAWNGDGTLYHSRAYAPEAGQTQSWSRPAALEYVQNNIGQLQLRVDSDDQLYLVYAIITGRNSGIYLMKSTDGGQNWSDPFTIYKNLRSDRTVDFPSLAIGADGTVHTVWVETNYPEIFPPIGIRYARSTDGGETWSEPTALADGPYHYPKVITRGPNEAHVVYSGTQPDRFRFHTWSGDNGQSWAPVAKNTAIGGYQGMPDLTLDSQENIHWLTVADYLSTRRDTLYHMEWAGSAWSTGEAALEQNEGVSQNMANVAAGVALGNEMHVVVQYPLATSSQPDGWQTEIFYIHTGLNSPRTAPLALATPTPRAPEATLTPATPAGAGTRATLTPLENQTAPRSAGLLAIITTSGLIALAVVTVVILIVRRARRL